MRALVLALIAGCAEAPISKWEAAEALAEAHHVPTSSWCAGPAHCRAPISDVALFERCLVDLAPECWGLFR